MLCTTSKYKVPRIRVMKLKKSEIKLRDHEDYTEIVSPKNYQYMYTCTVYVYMTIFCNYSDYNNW